MAEILHHLGCIKPCKSWDIGYLPYQLVQDFFHQKYFHPKSVGIALEAELGGDSEDALSPAAVGVARNAGWK